MVTLSFTHQGPNPFDEQEKSRLISPQPTKTPAEPSDKSLYRKRKGRALGPPTFFSLLCLDQQHSVPPEVNGEVNTHLVSSTCGRHL